MKIANGKDVKIGIFDIETFKELFSIGIYDVDKKKLKIFEISKRRNDLYKFVKYYTEKPHDYWVSFNGISFDHPVLEYIVEEYNNWHDLSPIEICGKISEYADRRIDDERYNIPCKYKEETFHVPPIDLFKIHHFDNDAKRTSLKWCAFMMNMDVEEIPVDIKKSLSDDEIESIISYMENDIIVTLALLYVTLGDIDNVEKLNGGYPLNELREEYEGKNMIQDRFDVIENTNLPCLNWSDVKIGEEWNKKDYKDIEGITDDRKLISNKIVHPYGKKFKQFFPSTMSFSTEKLKNFIAEFGEEYVKNEEQEWQITINRTTYTVAKGGLHSNEKHRLITVPHGYKYRDIDVGSQYPNSIFKLRIKPPHLTDSIINQFEEKIDRRLVYKKKANILKEEGKYDESRVYSSVQEMLKLCLNGGYYGKLGQPGSFLEYPEGLLKVCISNQIEILMLIEMMEEKGFSVLSGNTDGITVMYNERDEKIFLHVCEEWENKVGNIKMGKLEHTIFKKVWQENVNNYFAIKDNGTPKKKGRFATSFKLNKNKSALIIKLALEKYFMEGISPEVYIPTHSNIHDFCICKKATGKMHYEQIINEEEVIIHKKMIRYYVGNEGYIFKKRGLNYKDEEVDSYCEALNKNFPWMGYPKLIYFNSNERKDSYNINYSYYILKTLEIIDSIEKKDHAKRYADKFKTEQFSLF